METEHSSLLPSSLFTLVRDCGKNQPAAEGEGGRRDGEREERKPACSKPDHSGSEWSPPPLLPPLSNPGSRSARPGGLQWETGPSGSVSGEGPRLLSPASDQS